MRFQKAAWGSGNVEISLVIMVLRFIQADPQGGKRTAAGDPGSDLKQAFFSARRS